MLIRNNDAIAAPLWAKPKPIYVPPKLITFASKNPYT